jgi:hypothetical protein
MFTTSTTIENQTHISGLFYRAYDSIQKALKAKLKIDYFLYCQEVSKASEIPSLLEQLDSVKGYVISQKVYETIIDKEETKFGLMVVASISSFDLRTTPHQRIHASCHS